jgi:hypothetical protein
VRDGRGNLVPSLRRVRWPKGRPEPEEIPIDPARPPRMVDGWWGMPVKECCAKWLGRGMDCNKWKPGVFTESHRCRYCHKRYVVVFKCRVCAAGSIGGAIRVELCGAAVVRDRAREVIRVELTNRGVDGGRDELPPRGAEYEELVLVI